MSPKRETGQSETMFVRPKVAGAVVRDPNTRKPLPAEGALVPRSRYWLRRLADGSCVKAERPKAALKKSPKATEGS